MSSSKFTRIKNISLYQNCDSRYITCSPFLSEGRIMIVANVGRVAVDAEVPKANGANAYGKDVWS